MDIEPTTEYEDMNIPVNNHHKQTAKSSLPDGWTEVAGVFDEGQHLYVKTVVSQQLPFIWHPRKCKFDFSSKHSEFYSNNNKCIGPTIVCHLWENQNNLQAVLEEFNQMIPCPGITDVEFNPLRHMSLPTGEYVSMDSVWRSNRFKFLILDPFS